MTQRHTLGGRMINAAIETTNSPHGRPAMPWWGIGLRFILDASSVVTARLYD